MTTIILQSNIVKTMNKKEHLLYYMMRGEIHLSKKDYGFFNNLNYIIKDKDQITSNQNKLFDKLIVKYQRQLRKHGHELEKLQQLNWDVPIVETLEEYLNPKIFLDNYNHICLRAPFNSKFLQDFNYNDENNTFSWNKDERLYSSKFYTHALKLLIDTCSKHWDKIEYCDRLTALLEPLKEYKGISRVPTLVKENDNYTIKNSNKSLLEAIGHITLDDDPKTIYELSKYGIATSKDIIDGDPIRYFASQFNAKIDLDVLLNNVQYFSKLGIKNVFIPARQANPIYVQLKHFFDVNGIRVLPNVDTILDDTVQITMVKDRTYTYLSGNLKKKIGKIIELKNSRPVDVK